MVTHMQTDRCPPPAADAHDLIIIGGDGSAEKLVALLRSHGVQCWHLNGIGDVERGSGKRDFHLLKVVEFIPASGSQL